MSCPCRKCINERSGPFEMPHHTVKIICRACGERSCPRAENHEIGCAGKKVFDYGF